MQSSLTSQVSSQEETLDQEEDLWTTWGRIISEWDQPATRKKLPLVKVRQNCSVLSSPGLTVCPVFVV